MLPGTKIRKIEPTWLKYFPHRFYINLDHRKDRREHFENEMRKHKFTAIRFPGITPTDKGNYKSIGDRGCTESHKAIVRMAQENNWPNVMIFEDDAYFIKDFNVRMNEAVEELKNVKWDLFYCYLDNRGKVIQKLKSIQKINGTYNTHAYTVNNCTYKKFLENNKVLIDINLMKIQNMNKYSTILQLSSQINNYSDRIQNIMDHNRYISI